MKCERIAELLPDFLRGTLERERAEVVEQHLAACAECRDDVAVWKKLVLLPAVEPGPASRERFQAMLLAYQAGREEREVREAMPAAAPKAAPRSSKVDWLRSPMAGLAWGLALLLIGIFAGNAMGRFNSRTEEVAAMHTELSGMRQLLVLSMLQQQSASERLQAVSYSQREERLDPKVLSALLHTLRSDSSVDVRLAALDALSRHPSQPQVRNGVSDALESQQSPLVQVALIDQLMEWRDPNLAQRLREFEKSANLNPTVRERAQWALSKLQ
ncbi:MAG TPA: zf-HC2 domain-containing protein [Patescibacteria group bacterium]|nr:zf-HC2 domain-containing protein [Patescibacteria group bacterium]